MVDFLVSYNNAAAEQKLHAAVQPFKHKRRVEETGVYYYLSSRDAEKVHNLLGEEAEHIDWGAVTVNSLKEIE